MDQFKKVLLSGQRDKYQFNKGFSLLETTIAIAILVSAIIGPMSLSSRSIRSASVSKDNIIASNLSQEGIELVKNIRLNNRISGDDWMEGLSQCTSAEGCKIDAKDLSVLQCSQTCRNVRRF